MFSNSMSSTYFIIAHSKSHETRLYDIEGHQFPEEFAKFQTGKELGEDICDQMSVLLEQTPMEGVLRR